MIKFAGINKPTGTQNICEYYTTRYTNTVIAGEQYKTVRLNVYNSINTRSSQMHVTVPGVKVKCKCRRVPLSRSFPRGPVLNSASDSTAAAGITISRFCRRNSKDRYITQSFARARARAPILFPYTVQIHY